VVKAANIWKDAKQKEEDNTEFTFRPDAASPPEGVKSSNLFVFGKNTTQSATTQDPKTTEKQECKPTNQDRTNTSGRLPNKGCGRKGRSTKHQHERRQAELKAAKTNRKLSTKSKEGLKNSDDRVSEMTKQWLAQKNTKQQLRKKSKKRGKKNKGKKGEIKSHQET
jgi:hypothetical protein